MSGTYSLASSSSPFKSSASRCLLAGFSALVMVGIVMGRKFLPQFNSENLAPVTIWAIAASVLLAGLLRSGSEIVRLGKEWQALDLLRTDSSSVRNRFPDTVVALRVAAVDEAIAERRVEREFRVSNRALAAAKLAGVGSITRFGSSALLVLAVMGTFAGMRNALPSLIEAIKNTSTTGQAGDVSLGVEKSRVRLPS